MAYTAIPPVSSGGGGGGTSSAPISGDGSGGNPFTIANGALGLPKLATQANQTVVGNGSGGAASPVALDISGATSGLVATATVLNNTLTVGKAGGQTIIGGTAPSDGITVTTTTDAAKGLLTFGSSTGYVYDQQNGYHSWGIAAPSAPAAGPWQFQRNFNARTLLVVSNPNNSTACTAGIGLTTSPTSNPQSAPLFILEVKGPSFTASGLVVAGAGLIIHNNSTAPLLYQTGGDHIWTANNSTAQFRIKQTGSVVVGEGVATTATTGDLYVPSCAGIPTGVPELAGGNMIAVRADRTNNKLYIYSGGAWVILN